MSHAHSRQFTPGHGNPQHVLSELLAHNGPKTASWGRNAISAMVIGLVLALFFLQGRLAAASPNDDIRIPPIQTSSGPSPENAVIQPIEDLIDDLIDILEEAEQIATAHATPLSSQEKQTLDARLDDADSLIDQVFNPAVAPNLSPVDAGTVSLLFTPVTLADYAEQCIELTQDAKDEILLHGDLSDQGLIGTKLKTIRYLTSRSSPHNYRTKAGIN